MTSCLVCFAAWYRALLPLVVKNDITASVRSKSAFKVIHPDERSDVRVVEEFPWYIDETADVLPCYALSSDLYPQAQRLQEGGAWQLFRTFSRQTYFISVRPVYMIFLYLFWCEDQTLFSKHIFDKIFQDFDNSAQSTSSIRPLIETSFLQIISYSVFYPTWYDMGMGS